MTKPPTLEIEHGPPQVPRPFPAGPATRTLVGHFAVATTWSRLELVITRVDLCSHLLARSRVATTLARTGAGPSRQLQRAAAHKPMAACNAAADGEQNHQC